MTRFEREAKSKKQPKKVDLSKGLSSGSTMVNLCCSGRPHVAFLPGHYYLLPGDSQSGKTWIALSTLAEACRNPSFDGHHIIFDQPERGALMDMERYFGKRLTSRIRPPDKGSSKTIEDFYDHVGDWVAKGEPFVYVLDSEDALTSEAEMKKERQNRNARKRIREGDGEDKVKGSYGDGKAKKNSSGLRVAHNGLEDSGSILLVIKQSRDNIGPDAFFRPKTRSGGRALTFYATLEIWFSVRDKIRRTVMGKSRVVGTHLRIHVQKNREAGWDRQVEVPFYPSVGVDDTGSMVEFLIAEGHWKGDAKKGRVEAPEFDFSGKLDKLVELIESESMERDLTSIVTSVWSGIEEACAVRRKARYE